ncbi:MAG: Ig-like domain-containing protein, partial [Thermoanaerobaculia bacterium]
MDILSTRQPYLKQIHDGVVPKDSMTGNRQRQRSSRRRSQAWLWAVAMVLPVVGAMSVRAELRLSDQESEIYYNYAAVAGESMQVEQGVEVLGHLHSNDGIDLKAGSSVTGDVSAVGEVDVDGTVFGTVTEGADPLGLPLLLDEAELRALADRVFEQDRTFEDEVIDDIVFVAGTARIRGDVNGVGTLIATKDIRVDTTEDDVFFLADETRLSLIALDDIRIGKDRPFRGVLRAGRDVDIEKNVAFEGVMVADRKIHVKQDSQITFVDFDQVAPEIVLLAPENGSFVATSTPEIVVGYSDDFSGLRLDSAELLVDGVDRTAAAVVGAEGLTFTPSEPLADGVHSLEIAVSDHSDNEGRETFTFIVDTTPPVVAITSPAEVLLFNAVPPISAEYSDATSGIDLASVQVAVDGNALAGCTVAAASTSCPAPELAEGTHTVTSTVSDLAGNAAAASFIFEVIFDTDPPAITITAPTEAAIFNDATPGIAVEYSDAISGVDLGSLSVLIDGTDLTAGCTVGASGATCEPPELVEGPHTVTVAVSDLAGNAAAASFSFEVIFDTDPPAITINTPADGALLSETTVEVTGTVTD